MVDLLVPTSLEQLLFILKIVLEQHTLNIINSWNTIFSFGLETSVACTIKVSQS